MPSNCSTTINSLIQLHTYSSAGHVARGGGRAHASRRSWPRVDVPTAHKIARRRTVNNGKCNRAPNMFEMCLHAKQSDESICSYIVLCSQRAFSRTDEGPLAHFHGGNYFESISFEANEQFAVKKE